MKKQRQPECEVVYEQESRNATNNTNEESLEEDKILDALKNAEEFFSS